MENQTLSTDSTEQTVTNSTHDFLITSTLNLCTSTNPFDYNESTLPPGNVSVEVYQGGSDLYLELAAFIPIDFIGLIGNGFVLGVIVLCEDMRSEANYFICSLGVADFLVNLVVLPIVTATRWYRRWLLGESTCVFIAVINHVCMFASLFNLAAIAVNRAVITCKPGRYLVLFSKPLSLFYISITWFFSLMYALFPVLGWGEFKYDEKRFNCIFRVGSSFATRAEGSGSSLTQAQSIPALIAREAAPTYSIFFAACCILPCQIICGVSYAMILVTYVKSRLLLENMADVVVSGNTSSAETRLTKNLLLVWIVFFFCWLPITALFAIDPKGGLDERVYTAAVWLMLANSCVNPVIYGIQNKQFRRGYWKVIRKVPWLKKCRTFRIKPVAPALTRARGSRSLPNVARPPPQVPSETLQEPLRSDEASSSPKSHGNAQSSGLQLLQVPRSTDVMSVRGRLQKTDALPSVPNH